VLDPPGEWRAIAGIPDRDAKLALTKALLAHGANIEAKIAKPMPSSRSYSTPARTGSTPFLVAAGAGDAGVMRLLLASGADAHIHLPDGYSPIMVIISGGNAFTAARVTENDRIDAIKVALETGSDLETQDTNGYRAMHLAASAEFQGIITFLLEKGADLNPITKTRTQKEGSGQVTIAGQSPLGIVEGTFNGGSFNERPATAEFLRKLGAKSVGRATLQTYMKTFEEQNTDPAQKPTESRQPPTGTTPAPADTSQRPAAGR
jgi:hypothetical protein